MKKGNKGFTLIELLVVIAIIAILSTVVMAGLNSARSKARDAKRLSDIKQLQSALELYFDSCNGYPWSNNTVSNGTNHGIVIDSGANFNEQTTFGGCTTPLGNFISPFPANPYPNGSSYTYCHSDPSLAMAADGCSSGNPPAVVAGVVKGSQGYKISFTLENASGGLIPGLHYGYASSTGTGLQ